MKVRASVKKRSPANNWRPGRTRQSFDPSSFPNPAAPARPGLKAVVEAVEQQCGCSNGQARSAIDWLSGFVSKLRKRSYETLQLKPGRMELPEWALLCNLLNSKADSPALTLVCANLLQAARYEVGFEADFKQGTIKIIRLFPGS